MEESTVLWMLSFVMLIGSYLAGSLPLIINLSEVWSILSIIFITPSGFSFQDKLQLVSVLGAGLLVGTALAVIIPEGIRALFNSAQTTHDDRHSKSFNSTIR